ncbi:hypothetical protein ACRPL0_06820 [Streptococcus uberis]|uniref:hypothetical protein n=1 Tax=Streptococcus uberis TaxID=1349 RepID=UPI003D6BF519
MIRNLIVTKTLILMKTNERLADLALNQLQLLDQTKATMQEYKDFYEDLLLI